VFVFLSVLILLDHHKKQMNASKLAILFSKGGLSDIGRHAILVALEQKIHVTVITPNPEDLQETNWNCGCPEPHKLDLSKIELVKVKNWKDKSLLDAFAGATAVVSCLGHRQPFMGKHCCAEEGNLVVIEAMHKHNIQRVVAMTSSGVNEDWPPAETFPLGKNALSCLFYTFARRAFRDLTNMETNFKKDKDIDYLFVRPTGLGEDVVPSNEWFIQKRKYEDPIGYSLAKMDAARFCVQEALQPTMHRTAVVLGSDPAKCDMQKHLVEKMNQEKAD